MAIYSSVMNVGAFVCPMLGVALADTIDIRWVLIIGGVVRLLGAMLFWVWRLENVGNGSGQLAALALRKGNTL